MSNRRSKKVSREQLREQLLLDLYAWVEHVFARLDPHDASKSPSGEDLLQEPLFEQVRSAYKEVCHERYEDLRAEKNVDNDG